MPPGFPQAEVWDLDDMAPLGPLGRVNMDYSQWFQLCDRAIHTWSSLSDSLPQDYVLETGPGFAWFQWHWASLNELRSFGPDYNQAIAGTLTFFNDGDYPCRITANDIIFSYNPQSPSGVPLAWGVDCAPGCLSGELDFLSAAVHEYGHALGLDHTQAATSTMYPRTTVNDTISKTLAACDINIVKTLYRDNFGPSVVESFSVEATGTSSVSCSWTTQQESGCMRFRVSKVCSTGETVVVADSVPCLGPGVPYVVVDSDPCGGETNYVLSVIDSMGPGVAPEILLREQTVFVGTGAPMFAAASMTSDEPPADELRGYGSPDEAVRELGEAVNSGDMVARRRAIGDGFAYYASGGFFWGATIDGILEDARRSCQASSDLLELIPATTEFILPDLARVTVFARFIFGCQPYETNWTGRIEALVEKRSPTDGWRIREMRELW